MINRDLGSAKISVPESNSNLAPSRLCESHSLTFFGKQIFFFFLVTNPHSLQR
jgi:hypothetical protein